MIVPVLTLLGWCILAETTGSFGFSLDHLSRKQYFLFWFVSCLVHNTCMRKVNLPIWTWWLSLPFLDSGQTSSSSPLIWRRILIHPLAETVPAFCSLLPEMLEEWGLCVLIQNHAALLQLREANLLTWLQPLQSFLSFNTNIRRREQDLIWGPEIQCGLLKSGRDFISQLPNKQSRLLVPKASWTLMQSVQC